MIENPCGFIRITILSFLGLRPTLMCGELVLMLLVMGFGSTAAAVNNTALWEAFRTRFVTDAGRVVDTGNSGVSHSEGQGYAMLLAHAHGDKKTFESIWNWTQENLQIRSDALLAWSWKPSSRSTGSVADTNNATDGDLLVAWALSRAADTWENLTWKQASQRILHDVRKRLIRPSAVGLLLLPGIEGFEKTGGYGYKPLVLLDPGLPRVRED